MLRRAAARAAAECGRGASVEAASCSGRARSLVVSSAAAAASPVAVASARTHLLPLSVRLALAEARAAAAAAAAEAGRAGEGRLAHTFQTALLRATPFALAELARGASVYCYAVSPQPPVRHAAAAAALALPRSSVALALHVSAEVVLTLARVLHLGVLFAPLLFSAPLCLGYGWGRDWWLHLLNNTLRRAGPAFIKWGQWAATRADLFPPDMCLELTSLQSDAPSHSFAHTRRTVERAFGQPLESLFVWFEEAPVASGSIAQVHRAKLRHPPGGPGGAQPEVVAVKVRHPDVAEVISRDFTVLRVAAEIAGVLPGLSWMRLDESVRQFREPLFEQVDLSREASNLRLFNANFASWRQVSFPKPIEHLVQPAVLVETFEEGASIAQFLKADDSPYVRRVIADLGCKALLKMMLADNFVHADLHPGNILVRMEAPSGLLSQLLPFRRRTRPHLVLLDCGMTASLSDRNKHNLFRFFEAITRGDGKCVAETALAFSENQTCPQPQAFVDDLVDLFSTAVAWGFDVNTSEWMAAVLDSVRRHQVHLASEVCSVVVTALVLEGWSNRLDPDICIMEQIRQIVFGPERFIRRMEDLAKTL